MRDDKKREELEKELLAEAFDECMDEQLSFIPSEREIARMHRYSEDFQQNMQELLDAAVSRSGRKTPLRSGNLSTASIRLRLVSWRFWW